MRDSVYLYFPDGYMRFLGPMSAQEFYYLGFLDFRYNNKIFTSTHSYFDLGSGFQMILKEKENA